MLPELNEIKLRRKQFGLTQAELARRAGVSQSLVAKVEAGSLVPGYVNAKHLFDVLDELHEEVRVNATELMTRKVLSIESQASLSRAAKTMKEKGVSQLPVIDNDKVVGTISEKDILERIQRAERAIDLGQLTVAEVMGEPLPMIHEQTSFPLISSLLEHYPAVLIGKKGRAIGVISKSDLLKVILYKKKGGPI